MPKLLLVANVSKEHIRKFHIPFILHMKELGWQVDVACRLDEPVPECDHAFDLPCDRNPLRGGLTESIRVLRRIVRENGYDVVHCNTVTGAIVARLACAPLRKQGVKVFYTCHGMHFFKGAPASRWIVGWPMEKLLAPMTDLLITINGEDRDMAHKHLGACGAIEKIDGIGVNLDKYLRGVMTAEERAAFRRSLGLGAEDFVITYVAELIANKNQQALLQMLDLIRDEIPQAKLMLVGPDHEDGKLLRQAEQMGLSDRVLCLGWRSDVPKLLGCSDLYTASSRSEGLGLNIIEAMCSGLPVAALRNRGHCELIDHGRNGFLADQDDIRGLADSVLTLYRDEALRQRITRQAQQDVCRYDTAHVLEQLAAIYEKHGAQA